MIEFKIGDLVNSIDNRIQNAEIIDIFSINNAAMILWKNGTFTVYLKHLILIKHRPFHALLKRLKYKIKIFIYIYNPLNYRITHKDNIDNDY